MAKRTLQIPLTDKEIQALSLLAGAAGSKSAMTYAQMWILHLVRLKREYALHALTAIPRDYFKGYPGRPSEDELDSQDRQEKR